MSAILAPGATTPFRYTFTRNWAPPVGFGTCDPSTINGTSDLGTAAFVGVGNVHYDIWQENRTFFIAEIEQ